VKKCLLIGQIGFAQKCQKGSHFLCSRSVGIGLFVQTSLAPQNVNAPQKVTLTPLHCTKIPAEPTTDHTRLGQRVYQFPPYEGSRDGIKIASALEVL
jgi:hypothetical protein